MKDVMQIFENFQCFKNFSNQQIYI